MRAAHTGMEACVDPPVAVKDIAWWINRLLADRNAGRDARPVAEASWLDRAVCINGSIEESTVNSRPGATLLPQVRSAALVRHAPWEGGMGTRSHPTGCHRSLEMARTPPLECIGVRPSNRLIHCNGACCSGGVALHRRQDEFIRDHIGAGDALVLSVGGNDIALRPTLCTILNTACLIKCLPRCCLSLACACLPSTHCCCADGGGQCTACTMGCLCAVPSCIGYFVHLFRNQVHWRGAGGG